MSELDALLTHFFEYTDRVWYTGFQDIVGIYEQGTGIRVHFCIGFECGIFIRETHDPAVGMRSENRHIEHLTGEDIGCSGASADYCSTCTVDAGIRSLSTAETEFHDSVTTGCIAYSGCFCGNQTLMVDNIQDCSLDKLCFHDRRDYFNERFAWEDNCSFRDCINIAGEME